MSTEKRIYKPKSIAGFPEWLPEERLVEQKWFDHIRRVFESYGYCNIETPSVEELDVLTAKGEVDKEIYVIERLHKDENDKKEARLALHFDQTVPMARYVAMNFNELVFPFKRYQMQRVWRGERPQMGRMREFYQCDIDIINVDNLPLSFDAEVAAVMYEVLEGLPIRNGKRLGDEARVRLKINNRKILYGYFDCFGISNPDLIQSILTSLDRVDKIGPHEAQNQIKSDLESRGISSGDGGDPIAWLLNILFMNEGSVESGKDRLERLANGYPQLRENKLFNEGVSELFYVIDYINQAHPNAAMPDLKLVRGLDYYTGTVYETQLLDVPEFTGSVCSGGRYDDLAGSYINKHLPGVGISIGFSRLFDVMRQTRPDLLGIGPKSPAHVMMTVPENEADRPLAYETARALRKNGIKVEMYHAPKKIGDQLKYASKKLIPYVWMIRDGKHEVKDMTAQTQEPADPNTWKPKA